MSKEVFRGTGIASIALYLLHKYIIEKEIMKK